MHYHHITSNTQIHTAVNKQETTFNLNILINIKTILTEDEEIESTKIRVIHTSNIKPSKDIK